MNFNNFTIKSQEAVQEAVNLVQSRGQQAIEPVHIMQGVMKVGENVTNFIFQKLGMNGQQVALVVDRQIDSLPKVSGGEPYLSRESNEVLQKATQYSKEMGDEFVSLEHIILALLTVKSTVSTILKDAGMTEKELRNAISELRKGEKVTSQSSEDTYQSLEKYAINLNEAARSLGRRYMFIRRISQILIIKLAVPIGQHRLMVICPSIAVRRIGMFPVGAYQLDIMHSYHRRQLSVVISRVR